MIASAEWPAVLHLLATHRSQPCRRRNGRRRGVTGLRSEAVTDRGGRGGRRGGERRGGGKEVPAMPSGRPGCAVVPRV